MSTLCSLRIRSGWLCLLLLSVLLAWNAAGNLHAQIIDPGYNNRAVGGVSIDSSGLLNIAQTDALGELAKLRSAAIGKAPEGLQGLVEMRKISLRGLEEAIADCMKNKRPLPDEIKYLAGLQRIQYVFVYPEEKDIVLAGPGEGWKVDAHGNVVGATTGKAVLHLDDLLTALRSAMEASQAGITCSIDPTKEGIARLNQLTASNPNADLKSFEEAMGNQQITVTGVPGSSRFARILVAADYRMKRIGMGFEPAPQGVKLPSYMQMVASTRVKDSSPRWWMEPKFDAILKDASGMAWELRGSAVQTLTQEDAFDAKGERRHTNKNNTLAKRWADMMTKEFSALAVGDPVFADLQNCMEMAVVSALILKERLPEKAGNSFPTLFTSTDLKTEVYNVPTQVPSVASLVRKTYSVSGGVTINSWAIADNAKTDDSVASLRDKTASKGHATWWWN